MHCAFEYHGEHNKALIKDRDKGIRRKGDFHFFHTVEFHLLIVILAVLFGFTTFFGFAFFFIFIGMIFPSTLDMIWLSKEDFLYVSEYFFKRRLWKMMKKKLFL